MKIRYSWEVDILAIEVPDSPAEYAQESDGVITHFGIDRKPVILEIQGGRNFLLGSITSMVNEEEIRLP